MPDSKIDANNNVDSENKSDNTNQNDKKALDDSADKAIELFRKIREDAHPEITEKQIAEIDKECEIIKNREIISQNVEHEATEIISKNGEIITGPPTLTRFEKARIMGARALQLSLGAPLFIPIPKNAITSLEIAMD